MEIQGDINNILRDIKIIEKKMSETNKIDKKIEFLNELKALCNLYIKINGVDEVVLDNVPITKFQLSKAPEYMNRNNRLFYNNFIDNIDFHTEFADIITSEIEKLIYNFKFLERTKTKTKDEQKIKIISKFYDEYDDIGTDILLELLRKNRVYKIDKNNGIANGYTVMLPTKKRSFIVINKDDKDYVYEMINLVHELGHMVDFEYLSKYGSRRIYDYYNLSIFTETLPYYYQVEFLNYLIDNKLNTNNSKYYYQNLYDTIDSFGNNLLFISEYIKDNKELKNIDELFNSINYFYGQMLGIYLSNLRKNDPDKYRYIFNKFMKERTNIFDKKQFELISFNHYTCLNALKDEAKILTK